MQHLLAISQLTREQILTILCLAEDFKSHKPPPKFQEETVATLFYENSTRTRISFELAAKRLSMGVINVDLAHGSENKGETIEDTVRTLHAMGIRYFVIRHAQSGMPDALASHFHTAIHVLNAGDGTHAHPSQALLDMMTIRAHKPDLANLKVAVLGDIKHSRVANSFQCICKALGVGDLVMVAPTLWQPETIHYGTVTDNVRAGLAGADIVMCLRIQKERLGPNEGMDLETYRREFALTESALAYAKDDVLVMHPGPMNRGLEIDNSLAYGKKSVIFQQVTNGVFVRMAILAVLAGPA